MDIVKNPIIYTVYVRSAFGSIAKYYFDTQTDDPREAKTKLMTLVGCLYSKMDSVDRIDYQTGKVKSEISASMIQYSIDIHENIRLYTSPYKEEENGTT